MAFTADAIIANITSRLGDGGSHIWNYYKLARGTAWCAGEVSYTFKKTGNAARWYGGKPVFYVPYAQEWMAKNYKTIYDYRGKGNLANVRKGDVVIFMWSRGSRDHIGFARASGTSTTLYTIEGNTSGSKVANRTRDKANIYAVYRPPYSGKAEPLPPLVIDGEMGPETNSRLQRWLGVTEDGEIGKNTTKALQKKIGMSRAQQDGIWGPITTRELQRYLIQQGASLTVSAVLDRATVKALQRYLNKVVTK